VTAAPVVPSPARVRRGRVAIKLIASTADTAARDRFLREGLPADPRQALW
jgi:hypothetical protein